MGHPECRVYYTGRADNVYRESYDSAFRHELPLLYWDCLSSGGTGAEQYVKLIQQIHRLGGGADAPGFLGRLFVGGETFRKCISGFLARQRRALNRPCPSCPKEELDGQLSRPASTSRSMQSDRAFLCGLYMPTANLRIKRTNRVRPWMSPERVFPSASCGREGRRCRRPAQSVGD